MYAIIRYKTLGTKYQVKKIDKIEKKTNIPVANPFEIFPLGIAGVFFTG